MKTNSVGIALIKSSETLRLRAYRCPAGVLTIGWGHTGPDVKPGQVLSGEAEADEILYADLEKYEAAVTAGVRVTPTSNQFSALVSFCFNVGRSAFLKSTLLRLFNAGDIAGASLEFARWNKSKGKVLDGLTTRRANERILFLTPDSAGAEGFE